MKTKYSSLEGKWVKALNHLPLYEIEKGSWYKVIVPLDGTISVIDGKNEGADCGWDDKTFKLLFDITNTKHDNPEPLK